MPKKGENIFKRKDGRWEARYIHHYENGKAKYRYLYGRTYTEAKNKRVAELKELKKKQIPKEKQLATFEMIARLWLLDKKTSVKESTYTRYDRIIKKYLFPMLKSQLVSRLDKRYLSKIPQKLLEEGGKDHMPLSAKTVSDIVYVLKAIFKYGKENNYPCPTISSIKYPKNLHRDIKILTAENRVKIEAKALNSEDTISLGIIFSLFTGVRIGELCGLKWEDIDFDKETVTVRRTIERIANLDEDSVTKTKIVVSEPKTEHSIRIIPLPHFMAEYLKDRKRNKRCYLLTGNEKYTEPHQYYVKYRKYLKENGMEEYTFHALRHTFATRCVEEGFDQKSLAEILGHSTVKTTLEVYVHPTMEQKKMQMQRLVPISFYDHSHQ
jgi:integrase